MSGDILKARWISLPDEKDITRSQMAIFRLDFSITELPEAVCINISAADRYRLYVNGDSVISGPRKGDRYSHYYETVDIAGYLKKGENCITVRVCSYPSGSVSRSEWGPLSVETHGIGSVMILYGNISLPFGEVIPLSTGEADWRALIDKSYQIDNSGGWCVIQTEKFYADRYNGWRDHTTIDFPKAATSFYPGVGAHGEIPIFDLRQRMIPNMYEKCGTFSSVTDSSLDVDITDSKIIVPPGGTAFIELDAGELVTAFLRLRSSGRGGKITVTYSERYFPKTGGEPLGKTRRDDSKNGVIFGQHDEIYPSENETVFENFQFRTFRFARIDITAAESEALVYMPDFILTAYPLEVKANIDFEKPEMSRLWEMSLRTLKNCMHETYEDCPYYEQMQYEQDARLEALYTYAVSGDTRLAANALWDFHCSALPSGLLQSRYPSPERQVIPGFSLYWILMLEEYIIQSSDTSCLKMYMPTVDGILRYYDSKRNKDGLCENLGYWEFGDWSEGWELGVPGSVRCGASSLHNLNYSLALRSASRLCGHCGREGLANEYIKRSEEINNAVVKLCFDSEKGMIREGKDYYEYSQHTQVLAALCDALPKSEACRAVRVSMEDKEVKQCTLPWHYTMFRAFEKLGLYDELAPMIFKNYYPLLDMGLTTMPEGKSYDRSDCHGWSAVLLYEYTRMILGVKPGKNGWDEMIIEPHPCGCKRMSGKVPTPNGEVFVEWHIADGKLIVNVRSDVKNIKIIT